MTLTSGSVAVLFAGIVVAGCGGAPPAPAAGPESAASAPVPTNDSPSASATPSENAEPAPSGSAPATGNSAGPGPSAPKRPSASVDLVVAGKHAGDASIERVVSGVKTGLQSCYQTGLDSTPTAEGTVEFRINVTDSGAIKKVESSNPNTMPGSVTNCMVGRFGALSFEPRPKTIIEVKVTCRPGS